MTWVFFKANQIHSGEKPNTVNNKSSDNEASTAAHIYY